MLRTHEIHSIGARKMKLNADARSLETVMGSQDFMNPGQESLECAQDVHPALKSAGSERALPEKGAGNTRALQKRGKRTPIARKNELLPEPGPNSRMDDVRAASSILERSTSITLSKLTWLENGSFASRRVRQTPWTWKEQTRPIGIFADRLVNFADVAAVLSSPVSCSRPRKDEI